MLGVLIGLGILLIIVSAAFFGYVAFKNLKLKTKTLVLKDSTETEKFQCEMQIENLGAANLLITEACLFYIYTVQQGKNNRVSYYGRIDSDSFHALNSFPMRVGRAEKAFLYFEIDASMPELKIIEGVSFLALEESENFQDVLAYRSCKLNTLSSMEGIKIVKRAIEAENGQKLYRLCIKDPQFKKLSGLGWFKLAFAKKVKPPKELWL